LGPVFHAETVLSRKQAETGTEGQTTEDGRRKRRD
jgi:hypothetical protein